MAAIMLLILVVFFATAYLSRLIYNWIASKYKKGIPELSLGNIMLIMVITNLISSVIYVILRGLLNN